MNTSGTKRVWCADRGVGGVYLERVDGVGRAGILMVSFSSLRVFNKERGFFCAAFLVGV